jgi:hypothetical protein
MFVVRGAKSRPHKRRLVRIYIGIRDLQSAARLLQSDQCSSSGLNLEQFAGKMSAIDQ